MDEKMNGGGIPLRAEEYPGSQEFAGKVAGFPAADESPLTQEDVIFLELGEEKTQNVVKAMAHPIAGEIYDLLSLEGPLRLSDINKRLNISLNTAKYHVNNLKNNDILEISDTRYSMKGKKVKIFRLKNQILVIAPKKTSADRVRTALMKYPTAFAIFLCVFCVSLVTASKEFSVITLHNAALGSGAMVVIQNNSGIITALVTATAVTLLLLVISGVYSRWQTRRAAV
jgi:hypothetical protein